jgi:predicted permease
MPLLPRLSSLWRNLFHKDQMDQELTEEVRAYLELLVEEKIKKGLKPEEARRAALIELGGEEQVKESVREIRMGHYIETIWQDLRYGARMLTKSPGFTAVAVLSLALGIGANTAIFSVVYGLLLRPLPYPNSDRLVTMLQAYPQKGLDSWGLCQANIAIYRDRNQVFEKFAAYSSAGYNLKAGNEPERLRAATVTADFFDVLGVQPALGRIFRLEEDAPGKNLVCILSYGLWQRRFGGDPRILGQALILNDTSIEVVGIMPEGFTYPRREIELWLPLGLNPQRVYGYFNVGIARLKPGVTVSQAQAETTAIFWNAARENPAIAGATAPPPEGADMKTLITPLSEAVVGETKRPLLVLLGAVGLVLLIACANVANLLLARSTARTREIAMRFVLGATPGRVVRQLLTESLMLSMIGAIAGSALAWWGVRLLGQLPGVEGIRRLEEVTINPTILIYTASLALLTGFLFGLAPALQAYRLGLNKGMREGLRGSAGAASRRMNNILVAAQFALCLVLLIGAGLLLKSFQRLTSVNPGFQSENVLSMRLDLTAGKYPGGEQSTQFYESLLERVQSVPGVRTAGIVSDLPFGGSGNSDGIVIEGQEPGTGGLSQNVNVTIASPGYFQTMGIPLIQGRDFQRSDRGDSLRVAIVDETLARRFWQDGNAMGKRIRLGWQEQWMTIVGVVAGVKTMSLGETVEPHLYYPHTLEPSRSMYLAVRTVGKPTAVTGAIRSVVRDLDPGLPVWGVQPMTMAVDRTLNNQRLTNLLLTIFALLAVLLAAVGIYGVMSVYVSNRTNEFGIRLALGAQPRTVLRLVVSQGMRIALCGMVVGAGSAFWLMRFLESLLFEVKSSDPLIFTGVALGLMLVALIACYLPARRATKVDPLVALRYE